MKRFALEFIQSLSIGILLCILFWSGNELLEHFQQKATRDISSQVARDY